MTIAHTLTPFNEECLHSYILELLRESPMTSTELEAATRRHRSTVRNVLIRMEADHLVMGEVKRDRSRRFTQWTAQRVIRPPKLVEVDLTRPHRDPLVAALFGAGRAEP